MWALDDESVAVSVRLRLDPDTLARAPGFVTVTVLTIVQVKAAWPLYPALSTAVAVTWKVPAAEGAPLTTPVPELMVNPVGRPVADQLAMVAVDEESAACRVTGVMAPPVAEVSEPGLVTVTTLEIDQANAAVPL